MISSGQSDSQGLGLLLSFDFNSQLPNELKPVPISDAEHGRHSMMFLDGFLINPETKIFSSIVDGSWWRYVYSTITLGPATLD